MGEVDPAFIQDQDHRPKLSIIEAEGIPLIDLSVLSTPDAKPSDIDAVVKEIGNACKNWGFFQVINHGVPLDKRENIENASRKFFAQPLEEKRKIRRDEVQVFGYYDGEHTKNVRDWKEVFDYTVENPTLVPASHEPDDKGIAKWYNQWPEYPPELREACEEYAKGMEKLSYTLMELIALSLGLPKDRFKVCFKDQTSFLRLNYYPPCPVPHLALGVGRHKDAGALTVLAQDNVGGLEVKRKSDGEWIRVKPTPNAYIINVGDITQERGDVMDLMIIGCSNNSYALALDKLPRLLAEFQLLKLCTINVAEVWSNEKYESVEHRVMVNSEKERFSIPFFFNPAHYIIVKPLEELTSEKNPPKYRPYNWGKFLINRKRSNFMKLKVENIQIAHFRESELASQLEGVTIN